MFSSTRKSAQQLLDQVQRHEQLEAFSADDFAAQVAEEIAVGAPPTLAALELADDQARATLAAVDAFITRAMRIHLDHALAGDTSVATPFRKVIATTVTAYEHDLELLRERVASSAARVDPDGAAQTARTVVEAARQVLALRAALWAGVLGHARALATAHLPTARRAARDPHASDAERLRWSAARRDLELIVERPERLAAASFADRLAALPPLEEPPEETPELSREELIELD